jgi:hypothetical protein
VLARFPPKPLIKANGVRFNPDVPIIASKVVIPSVPPPILPTPLPNNLAPCKAAQANFP